MKELLADLDTLAINLAQGDMLVVNIVLAFVMFGVALGIKMQTFKDILRNRDIAVDSAPCRDIPNYNGAQSIYHTYGCHWYDSRGLVPRR